MEQYDCGIAILVYGGGYLYDIDLAPLIDEGVSYVFLQPKVHGIDWDIYGRILRGEKTPFEELLLDSSQPPQDE
jgi:hypothetical protein